MIVDRDRRPITRRRSVLNGDRDVTVIGAAAIVEDRVVEAVRTDKLGFGRVFAYAGRRTRERSVSWRTGDRQEQRSEVGIIIVCQRIELDGRIHEGSDGVVDGNRRHIRLGVDLHLDRRGRRPALAIRDPVCERVEAGERRGRHECAGAGAGAVDLSVEALCECRYLECTAVRIEVVGEDVDAAADSDIRAQEVRARDRRLVRWWSGPDEDLLRRLTALEVVAHGEGHGVRPVGQVDVGSAFSFRRTPSPKFQVRDSIASRSELVEVSVKSTSTGALEL